MPRIEPVKLGKTEGGSTGAGASAAEVLRPRVEDGTAVAGAPVNIEEETAITRRSNMFLGLIAETMLRPEPEAMCPEVTVMENYLPIRVYTFWDLK